MKALKVIGILFAVLGLSAGIFWFGWLRAPEPSAVCDNLASIAKKETGVNLPDKAKSECVENLQPPEFGRVPYVKMMKCMEVAKSSADLENCESKAGG